MTNFAFHSVQAHASLHKWNCAKHCIPTRSCLQYLHGDIKITLLRSQLFKWRPFEISVLVYLCVKKGSNDGYVQTASRRRIVLVGKRFWYVCLGNDESFALVYNSLSNTLSGQSSDIHTVM